MPNPETRSPMPVAPERSKSPEQLAHESAQNHAKAEMDAIQEKAKIESDAANAVEAAKTGAAGAKAKAEHEADVVAAGGTVENKTKKPEPSDMQKRVNATAKTGAAYGVAGASVLGKILGPALGWIGDKFSAGFDALDIWDLSGRKAAGKKKK